MGRRFGVLLLLIAGRAGAQYQTRPWLEWRTIETPRFAFHYPAELQEWTQRTAGRMEAIDSAVSAIVGFSPRKRVDVVVDDPFRVPNGSAWPMLNHPTLVLWASPPDPRQDIGSYTTWGDMLTSHEFAHLAHLTRPSRNGFIRAIWKLSPVQLGPIAVKSPRWVIEGYATYVEGVVTGSGRPHGYWRAAVLRQWAIEGNMPTYDQLDIGTGMYSGEFAYLAGSAFLEWLVVRRGEQSLRDLWARMSARDNRSFAAAFAGVYGEGPSLLYERYVAELTADAMKIAAAMRTADSGAAIQHLARETGDPAFSPDGSRAAIMLAPGSVPPRVVIWSVAATPDTLASRADRKLLERDPEDVAPIRVFPAPKRPLATLRAVAGQPYRDPRFFPDGRILVWRNSAIGDGSYSPDLYVWTPKKDDAERLTKGRNLRQGDVSPDGSLIAALRCAAGRCDLLTLPAKPGRIRVLAEGSETRSFARPRFSADGRSIIVAAHDSGYWRAARVSTESGHLDFLSPRGVDVFDPVEAGDSIIVATAVLDGIPTIVKLRENELTPLATVTGAAAAPEIDRHSGKIWFLSMHSRGWDVRATSLDRAAPRIAVESSSLAMPPVATPHFPSVPARVPSRSYSRPMRIAWFPGVQFTRDNRGGPILGLNATDLVGRSELLALLEPETQSAWHGWSATLTARAHPTVMTLAAYGVTRTPLLSGTVRQRGAMIAFDGSKRLELASSRLAFGGSLARQRVPITIFCPDLVGPGCPARIDSARTNVFIFAAAGTASYRNDRRSGLGLSGFADAGSFAGRRFRRAVGTATLDLPGYTLTATAANSNATLAEEQLSVGGPPTALTSQFVNPQLLLMPAIPMGVQTGRHAVTAKVSLAITPAIRAYQWFGRAWDSAKPDYLSVRGVEWNGGLPRIPTLGIPASRLNAGVGFWADAPRGRAVVPGALGGTVIYPRTAGRYALYVSTQFGDWSR
jgi:hypothetical protein